jgi:CHAD domain-containing protein
MALAEAARHVLSVRLRVVQAWVPRAVYEADRDLEHVHQLRVSTRRADAALRIFRDCLPGRARKPARQRLRALRRAAGAARDWDVFLLGLKERGAEVAEPERPGLDFLAGYATGQRVAAQTQLESADEQYGEDFDGFVNETLDAVRTPHDEPAAAALLGLARPLLARLLHDLERAAAGDLKDYEHLHQVRIAGKRLRYAMEVFADCFEPAFRERLYPMIEEMQEVLGRANDSHVAGQRLTGLRDRLKATWPEGWERLKAGIEGLLRFHQRRLPQERRRFMKWWETWREAGGREVLGAMQIAGSE